MKNNPQKKKKTPVIAPLLRRFAPAYALGIAMLFLVDYVNLFIPRFLGDVTDGLRAHVMTAQDVLGIAVRVVICGVVIVAGRFLYRYFIFGSCRKIERQLRDNMFEKLETLSQRYYNEHKTGDMMPSARPSSPPLTPRC